MRLFWILLFVDCFIAQAQDNKLRYHGFYAEAISLHPFNTDEYGDLVGFGFGVSFKSQEHIFRTHFTGATSLFSYLDSNPPNYEELVFLYGREYKLSERIAGDVFLGVAYFNFNNGGDKKTTSLGFPIKTSIRYALMNQVSLGIMYGFNANANKPVHRIGLSFYWKPKRGKEKNSTPTSTTPTKKFRYHSFSLGGQTLYPHGNAAYIPISGPVWSVSFVAGKHIFKCRTALGSGTQPAKSDDRAPVSGFFSFPNFSKGDPSNYEEQSLLYGRAFRPMRRMVTELYTGITHIDYTNQYHNIKTKQFGVPLQTEIRFYLTKTFALGVNGGINLSTKHSNHYWGAALRWNAKAFKHE